jgi:cell division transport system permease protein
MLVSSYRVTKFAFQNFWRNFWLSIITISMLVLTLMTVNILLLLNTITQQAINLVEDRIEVSVYFNETVEEATVTSAVAYLRGLAQVRDVEVVTAQEAYDVFLARHAGDEEVLASLGELDGNPFGPTLNVKVNDASDFDFILEALDNPQFRDDIRDKDFSDYQDVVTRIRDTTDRIRTFGIILSIIFLLIAVLIVFNTVRIGIFIHREEIGIMRLVGASNWFIKSPFFLEMILLSLLSVLISVAIVYPVVAIIEPSLAAYFGTSSPGIVSYFTQNGLWIFGLQFIGLVVVSVFSTSLAMRKFLRV